jgi:energy-coupling factor transporter ATP-binding protein EcfA2
MIKYHSFKALMAHRRNQNLASILNDCWLTRGGSAMIVGPSGSGKTKFKDALACALASGQEFCGFKPNRSFKVLSIQAEDTEEDIAESYQGYASSELDNDPDEIEKIEDNLFAVTLVGDDGMEFSRQVDILCTKHKPDVVVIDPLLAYLGCDVVDQKGVTTFLRKWMHPIMVKHNCGWIAVHHSRKGEKGGPALDKAIGSMEFNAFFRGVVDISFKDERPGDLTVRVVKRQRQMGWVDDLGQPTESKYVTKGKTSVSFTEVASFGPAATPVTKGRPPKANPADVAQFIEETRKTETDEQKVIRLVAEKFRYSDKQAGRIVKAKV